jgi:hypothetical protein
MAGLNIRPSCLLQGGLGEKLIFSYNPIMPNLPAYKNFSPFFALFAKTRPKPPFCYLRAFQPPKQNIITFLLIFVYINSHSTYLLDFPPSLIIESSHVSPAPLPFCFRRHWNVWSCSQFAIVSDVVHSK